MPFGIGPPSPTHLHRRVQGSQIFKQNWIILILSRVIAIFPIWVSLALWGGVGGWFYLGWPTIVYMSSAVFRGKESSNRIEISWLVQDLLNFGVLGSLQLWGGGRWVGGCLGHVGCPHTCTHACACMHTHVYMYRNCKWLQTWKHPCLLSRGWPGQICWKDQLVKRNAYFYYFGQFCVFPLYLW